jgi:hypothetical protein
VQSHKGVSKALLVTGDLITYSSVDIDQLGVLANLRALVNLSADISECLPVERAMLGSHCAG